MNTDLFDRVPLSWRAGLEAGRALLAPLGLPFPRARFLCGIPPAFAGIHFDTGITADGRSYADTAHVAWPCHLGHRPVDDRLSTVIIPRPYINLDLVVLHELAHVIHEELHARSGTWDVRIELPWSGDYSYTDYWELFACAVETLAGATAGHPHYAGWVEIVAGEEWRPLRELLQWGAGYPGMFRRPA